MAGYGPVTHHGLVTHLETRLVPHLERDRRLETFDENSLMLAADGPSTVLQSLSRSHRCLLSRPLLLSLVRVSRALSPSLSHTNSLGTHCG